MTHETYHWIVSPLVYVGEDASQLKSPIASKIKSYKEDLEIFIWSFLQTMPFLYLLSYSSVRKSHSE